MLGILFGSSVGFEGGSPLTQLDRSVAVLLNLVMLCSASAASTIQFPKMNMDRLLFYEAKVLFSEGRGRM